MKKTIHFSALLSIYILILSILIIGAITYLSNSLFKDYVNAILNHKPTIQEQIQSQLSTKLDISENNIDVDISIQDNEYAFGEATQHNKDVRYIWVGKIDNKAISLISYSSEYINCIDIGDYDISYEILPTCYEPYLKTLIDRKQRIENRDISTKILDSLINNVPQIHSGIKEIYMYWTMQKDTVLDQKRFIAYQIEYNMDNENTYLTVLKDMNIKLEDIGFGIDNTNTAGGNLSQYNGFKKDNIVCVLISSETQTDKDIFNIKLSCGVLD